MDRKIKILIALCAVLFIGGAAGSIWVLRASHGEQVKIVQDGRTLYTLDLDQEESQTFDVEYEGRTNTIEIKDGKIRVREAECPDQVCVETGWLDSAAPIICLPNRLVIEFADEQNENAPDAVVQ